MIIFIYTGRTWEFVWKIVQDLLNLGRALLHYLQIINKHAHNLNNINLIAKNKDSLISYFICQMYAVD